MIHLYMQHDLKEVPTYPLPQNYRFRLFSSQADEKTWAHIVMKTGEFSSETAALERFREEFSPYMEDVRARVVFVETFAGDVVGTATAWFGTGKGQTIGRLHWVEIIPEHQGNGLGRPLIAKAMHLLQTYHQKAYLKTQQTSGAAIHLYKSLGWIPFIRTNQEKKIWKQLN